MHQARAIESPSAKPSWAVLLLAHGSPDSLDGVEAFLQSVRGGRTTPPELLAEVRRRYALIGGRSPLLEITRAQARALEERLNGEASPAAFRVYVGMRHWQPSIQAAVVQIAQDGFRRVVALCLAPHYSHMSVGAYFQKVREAQTTLGLGPNVDLDVDYVESWHDHPLFVQALAANVVAARERFPSELREQVRVIFTAHSLPASIGERADPYEAQVRETARLVAERARLADGSWQFCYQSAGASRMPWLGPLIQDVIGELAEAGQRQLLVAPVGFLSDNVETLYDIDVQARDLARRVGAHLERTEPLNVAPALIEALADVVRRRVGAT